MANWKSTLNIGTAWDEYQHHEIELSALVKRIIQEIETNKFKQAEELQSIRIDFETFLLEIENIYDEDETVQAFDDLMCRLYNFGDIDHRIWIKT